MRVWSKAENLRLKARSIHLEEDINSILNMSHSAILAQDIQFRLNNLKAEYHRLLEHEVNSARLQSRVTWAKSGDANTKFFHAYASAKRNSNVIWSLKNINDNLVSKDAALKKMGK